MKTSNFVGLVGLRWLHKRIRKQSVEGVSLDTRYFNLRNVKMTTQTEMDLVTDSVSSLSHLYATYMNKRCQKTIDGPPNLILL